MTVLTFTTGLSCVLGVRLCISADGLFVSNLWFTYVCFHFKFTQKSVYDDFKMKLTHTCNNGLSCFFVCVSTERWILFSKFCQSDTHFLLTSFCFWFNCNVDNRLWEFHRFQNNWMFWITESVTGCCISQTNCSCNITCINNINILSMVCVHLQNTTDTFCIVFRRVINRTTSA